MRSPVELTLDAVPRVARIGFLSNPTGASMGFFAQNVDAGARGRGITVLTEEATTRDDLAPAFNRLAKQEVQAVVVPPNGLFRTNRAQIVQLALAAHLPTIFAERENVEAGGLASYGIDTRENFRVAAGYVDKILRGTKPGDLPIEFPTKVELVINLRTAKALGLTVSPQLLARAPIAETVSGRNLTTSSAQPAVSLLTEKNHPSGSTTTSKRSFDTSIPQKESMAIFISHPC